MNIPPLNFLAENLKWGFLTCRHTRALNVSFKILRQLTIKKTILYTSVMLFRIPLNYIGGYSISGSLLRKRWLKTPHSWLNLSAILIHAKLLNLF